MLARKKSSHFINNKFTSNLKILALLLMMRKIALVVKFSEKYVHNLIIEHEIQMWVWRIGIEYQVGDPEVIGPSPACVFSFLHAWRVKRNILFVWFRHIRVTAGA